MKLEARHVHFRYRKQPILSDVDLSVVPGELVGLIGPNGAGKTSLLKVLAGLVTADQGEVLLDEKPLQQWKARQLAKQLGYLAQGAQAHWPLTARRLVELGRLPHLESWQRLGEKDEQAITRAMQLTEVITFSERPLNMLSTGERLRVLIARMFATEPTVILADEPIAALDPYHQLHTMEILREHSDRGGTGIVVMHDLNIAARFCHRLVLLNNGQIVCDAKPEEVLQPQQLMDVYGIEAELIHTDSGVLLSPQARIHHKRMDDAGLADRATP